MFTRNFTDDLRRSLRNSLRFPHRSQEQSQQFTYDPLPAGSIRLLKFTNVREELSCTMTSSSLLNPPKFYALSYAWGQNTSTKTLLCNGSPLLIRENLHEAIQYLFSKPVDLDLPIWIDAVCINQFNDNEKSIEVGRMGEIYRKAHQVVVWLGPESSDSDIAIDALLPLSLTMPGIDHVPIPHEFPDLGLPEQQSEIWAALGNLFRREWFGRLWTFQEVVLARDILVICGREKIDWRIFAGVGEGLSRLSLATLCAKFEAIDPYLDGIRAVSNMALTRGIVGRGSVPDFRRLINIADCKLCLDPRDRVFGMLGLAGKDFANRIQVSYGEEGFEETYIECAKACLEERVPEILQEVGGRNRIPSLPSWVPNLNSRPTVNQYPFPTHFRAGISGTDRPADIFCSELSPGSNILTLLGFRVEIVSQVVESTFPAFDERPMWWYNQRVIDWESRCRALAQRTLSLPPDTIPEEHIVAICSLTVRHVLQRQDITTDTLVQAHKDIMANAESLASLEDRRTVCLPPLDRRSLFSYMRRRMGHTCSGRRYFSTQTGKLGVGPPDLRAGDVLIVVYGLGPLFAIREMEKAVGEWELVGDCFVREWMDLDEERERGEDEGFKIV